MAIQTAAILAGNARPLDRATDEEIFEARDLLTAAVRERAYAQAEVNDLKEQLDGAHARLRYKTEQANRVSEFLSKTLLASAEEAARAEH